MLPSPSNPMICDEIELVLPLSSSCLCRNTPPRASPRPLSKPPFVSTPKTVDFPESTFPNVVILISLCSLEHGRRRTKNVAHRFPVFVRRSHTTDTSHSMASAIRFNVATLSSISRSLNPNAVPSSSTPKSYNASPCALREAAPVELRHEFLESLGGDVHQTPLVLAISIVALGLERARELIEPERVRRRARRFFGGRGR